MFTKLLTETLHNAISLGDIHSTKTLIHQGADIFRKNFSGQSLFGGPLLACPKEMKSEILNFLLDEAKEKKYEGLIKDICLHYWEAINDIESEDNFEIIEMLCKSRLLNHHAFFSQLFEAILTHTDHSRSWVIKAYNLVDEKVRECLIQPPSIKLTPYGGN